MHGSKEGVLSILLSAFMAAGPIFSPSIVSAETITGETNSISSQLVNDFTRLAGSDRYETAAKIARAGWKDNSSTYAVLSAGMDENLIDALTAAPLAKKINAPILLTEGDELNSFAESELKRLGVKSVYLTSGSGIIKPKVLEQLRAMGLSVVSLGGKDRFETAVNIAKQLGTPEKVVVATAWGGADALSISSIAAAQGIPILLTEPNRLPQSTLNYLNSIKSELVESYIIGGEGAVSNSVKNFLPNSTRVAGTDRYKTNLEVLKTFLGSLKFQKTYLANGEDEHLVDSLVGAPVAAGTASPIVLVDSQNSYPSLNFAEQNLSPNLVVLGGEGVISDTTVTDIALATIFSENGKIIGSEVANPKPSFDYHFILKGANQIMSNLNIKASLYIQGNNSMIKNVKVDGTIFLDPGEHGTASLENVSAGNIVILSGDSNGIQLNNVTATSLRILSENTVKVKVNGTTKITDTYVSLGAVLDVNNGTLGQVHVENELTDEIPVVEFFGTYDRPIIVKGISTLKSRGATIEKVDVSPKNSEEKIRLEGAYKTIEVNTSSTLDLGNNASIKNLITNKKSEINVQSGVSVQTFNNKGITNTVTGDGASALEVKSVSTPVSSTIPIIQRPTTTVTRAGTLTLVSSGVCLCHRNEKHCSYLYAC